MNRWTSMAADKLSLWAVLIIAIPLLLISIFISKAIFLSIAAVALLLLASYIVGHVEFLILMTLFAPIIKASPLNPIPREIDLTVVFYVLLIIVLIIQFIFKKKQLPTFEPIDLIFILFSLIVIVSFFFSPNEIEEYALFKLSHYALLSAPFYFIARTLSDKEFKQLGYLFAFLGGCISLALFIVFPTAFVIKAAGNSYLTMATLIGIPVFFSICGFVQSSRFSMKMLFLFTLIVSLLLLFKTNSRAGILFGPFTVFLYLLFLFRKKRFLVLFLVVVLLVTTAITYLLFPDFFSRFFLIFKQHKGSSVNLRLTLLKVSKKLLSRAWFSGIGLGGFCKYHYLKYPHNIILEVFIEYGIAGVLALLTFLGLFFSKIAKQLKYGLMDSFAAPYVLTAFFLVLFHMTSFGIEATRVLLFFIGAVVTILKSPGSKSPDNKTNKPYFKKKIPEPDFLHIGKQDSFPSE